MDALKVTDEQLLEQFRDEAAFTELYRRHVAKVTAFALRRCSVAHEVPDLVAAIWLEVISSASSFDPRRGRVLPWILGVAAHLTASNERRRAREREAVERLGREPQLDAEDIAQLERQLDAVATARQAQAVLAQLPLNERVVAELVMIEGLQPREAAGALGLRPGTARMRLLRARTKLRHSLTPFRAMSDEPIPASEV